MTPVSEVPTLLKAAVDEEGDIVPRMPLDPHWAEMIILKDCGSVLYIKFSA